MIEKYNDSKRKTLKRVGYVWTNGQLCKNQKDVLLVVWSHVETVVLLSHKKTDGHINIKVEFGEGEGKVPKMRRKK